MRLPSRPVSAFAEMMIGFSFGEYPLNLGTLLLRRQIPRSCFLFHICSWYRVIKNVSFFKLIDSPHISLVSGHLAYRSCRVSKKMPLLVDEIDGRSTPPHFATAPTPPPANVSDV